MLIIREMQIKTTLHPSEWPSSKKSTNNKCWRGCGEKEILLHCWWERKLIQPLWKRVCRLKKKNRTKSMTQNNGRKQRGTEEHLDEDERGE